MDSTISAFADTSAALAAILAPDSVRVSVFSMVLFHTVSGNPVSSSRKAMGAPILPSPRNPNFTMGPNLLCELGV